jgi:hypothetical protein
MSDNAQDWVAVDAYFAEALMGADRLRAGIRRANAAAGLPPHDVSPLQGRFLSLLVKAIGARRILEIGTLGGVSASWMAEALPPDGRVVSLEASPDYAALARRNLERAGLGDRVEIHVGPALDTLARLAMEDVPAFDLIEAPFLTAMAEVMSEGEKRHGKDNWKRATPDEQGVTVRHLMGHLMRWLTGDRSEPHLAKVAIGAMFLHYHDKCESK